MSENATKPRFGHVYDHTPTLKSVPKRGLDKPEKTVFLEPSVDRSRDRSPGIFCCKWWEGGCAGDIPTHCRRIACAIAACAIALSDPTGGWL